MTPSEETRRVRARATKKGAASVDSAADAGNEGFRLISIGSARAPSGCSGHDWLVYRIAQGENIITGYRRGELKTASREVETIVTSLNERRVSAKTKPGRKAGQGAAPPKEEPES
jgi:hypothetical protein